MHRSRQRWESGKDLNDGEALEWRFYNELCRLIQLRKKLPALRNGYMEVFDTGNNHLFGFTREYAGQRLVVINNFSEYEQPLHQAQLNTATAATRFVDRVSGQSFPNGGGLTLSPYQFLWLECLPA